MDTVLFVSAIGATLLSLLWITIMWRPWYGDLFVGIAITVVLAIIAMPAWFIVLRSIWRVLSI